MSKTATPSPSPASRLARRVPSTDGDVSRLFLLGASLIVVAGIGVVVAGGSRVEPGQAGDIRRVLDTTTALAAVAVAILCRATWRQIGDRAALWAGAAALMVGVASGTRPELVGALLGWGPTSHRMLTAVSEAATALAPVLFAAGLVPGMRRPSLGPAAMLLLAAAVLAALTLVVRAAPDVGPALAVSQATGGGGAGSVVGGLVVSGAWLALAVGYTVRGLRRRWLYTWAGLLLFALTLAGLAAGAARGGDGWAVGAGAIEALGVLIAVVGCHLELTRAYEDQSLQLFDSTLEVETSEVRERIRDASLRARRHDLVNAVTAVDGAAMILEREFERLSPADREVMARLIASGTARLRRLVSPESPDEGRVSLAAAAAEAAADAAWGARVEVDVTADLVAEASEDETVEAVRQLVGYVADRVPAGPLTLRGERDGTWVVLRVEDRGVTMPRQLRRVVLDADSRRVPGRDGALGLRVAARLMRDQGGDLWVEPRAGGGTSFGICLPASAPENGDHGADPA